MNVREHVHAVYQDNIKIMKREGQNQQSFIDLSIFESFFGLSNVQVKSYQGCQKTQT